MSDAKQKMQAAMSELGLTISAKFVPFSQSRNKAEKHHSLNWVITLQRNGRDVMTTDYNAGSAHCPSYNKPVPAHWNRPNRMWQHLVTEWECENGYQALHTSYGGFTRSSVRKEPIAPDAADVVHCLVSDADVLNYSNFEDWAETFGYDPDSRKGEQVYRACLELALKLRSAIGEHGLAKLAEAGQDY